MGKFQTFYGRSIATNRFRTISVFDGGMVAVEDIDEKIAYYKNIWDFLKSLKNFAGTRFRTLSKTVDFEAAVAECGIDKAIEFFGNGNVPTERDIADEIERVAKALQLQQVPKATTERRPRYRSPRNGR